MATEEPGLLDAIAAEPDDDTARLVYADWLDENGQEARAEFIRVQIELALPNDGECFGCLSIRTARTDAYSRAEAKLPCSCQPKYQLLQQRQQQLLADPRNFVNWTPAVMHTGSMAGIRYETGGTVGLFGKGFDSAEFIRGFIDQITCTAADWLAHADQITACHPVQRVTITDASGWDARITQFDSHDADGTFGCSRWPGIRFTVLRNAEYAAPASV